MSSWWFTVGRVLPEPAKTNAASHDIALLSRSDDNKNEHGFLNRVVAMVFRIPVGTRGVCLTTSVGNRRREPHSLQPFSALVTLSPPQRYRECVCRGHYAHWYIYFRKIRVLLHI